MPFLMLKNLPRYECLLEAAKEFPELDPSACAAFLGLLRAGDEIFGVAERNLIRHNISQGRFAVMMLLWGGAGTRQAGGAVAPCLPPSPRTPAELAEAAGVTRATMTGLIDTLERDGFVKRMPDPEDRRMMSVVLTGKAQQFLRDLLPGHFQLMAALMRPLDETERQTLVQLLSKIVEQVANVSAEPVALSPPGFPTVNPTVSTTSHAQTINHHSR